MKIMSTALALAVLLAAATMTAQAQQNLQVVVPGNASGGFGVLVGGPVVPLVPAINVSGPGTVTVTYVSGTVFIGYGLGTGPEGIPCIHCRAYELPLQEANGLGGGNANNDGALMGVFVSQARINRSGFQAVDGTKNLVRVGIKPDALFLIGSGKTFEVGEAGTIFLGINDGYVGDNSGGFTVEVTGP